MAKQVNLSRARLCYLFKSESGMSAYRYLKSLRMKEAAVLLSTTFLSVKEIMARVGFGDESHFVKDFKKIYGMTPTEYRKSKANSNVHVSVLRAAETGPGSILIDAHCRAMLPTGTSQEKPIENGAKLNGSMRARS
jgi:hypothetical protein